MTRALAWSTSLDRTRRLAAMWLGIGMLAVASSCRDDGPTGVLRRPGAASRATGVTPSVEFYVHGSVEDWPVFMGNVAVASVQSGRKVVFIITTAGDGGQSSTYWKTRETGGLASIDSIIGAGAWTCANQTVNAHPLRRCAKSNVLVYFLRMPDGNYYDGTGYGYGSMSNLRDLGTPTQPIDKSTTYSTWADFTSTIQGVVSLESQGQVAATVQVSAPDYDRTINPSDHPDNAATADAVHAATQAMGWTLAFYVDYNTENMPVNLSQADHDLKQRIFLAYDRVMVAAHYTSDANDPDIAQWLWRTYYRVSSPVPPDTPTGLTAIANSKSRIDLQWVGNTGTSSGFYIERAPNVAGGAGTFAQVGNVPGNTTTYSDLAVAPGTKYWYRVRAYNDGGTSGYSNAATATTLTSQPLPYRGDAYIMAHADDWQIFAGDHAYASFQNAAAMLFIYSTAGDGGNPAAYWKQREKGALASIDAVIGAGTWACAAKTIRTHPIQRCTKNTTVVYFMRMPDGNYVDGTGYGYGSISSLRAGTATSAIDGSTTYTTWSDFYTTIGAIVDLELDGQSSPYVKVHAQEYDTTLDPKDHPDHNTTGDAVRTVAASHLWDLEYFVGYDSENRAVNITDTQHSQKMLVWTAYDNTMIAGGYPSDVTDPEYQAWVWRTYFRSILGTVVTLNPPSGLTATAASSSEIDLSWTDNSTNETSFSIERAADNGGTPGTFAAIASVGANVTTFANTGLSANTTYWYRVQAVNANGSSAYSNAVAVATAPLPPPVAPSGLAATASSSTQIDLAWTDNSNNETGFSIERAPDIAGGAGTYAVIATVGPNVTSYSNTGLSASTAYWYRVQAFNANGSSPYSNATSATTQAAPPPPPPAAPTNLALTVVSASQLNLTWTDNSTNETGFSIERAPDVGGAPGAYAVVANVGANVTTYANTGLSAATTYWYRVQAVNAGGGSAYSNATSAATLPTAPAAPTGLAASAASTSQINLSWTDNATNEAGFRIERAPDAGGVAGTYVEIATAGADVTTYSNTGLAASTTYWYRVRAYNAGGTSSYSNAVSAATQTPPPPPPAAPTALAAAAASTSQINLTWTDNATNETGFSIERAPDAGGAPGTFAVIASVGANVTTYSNTGLNASTTYWYRVQAFNSGGTSAYSNSASAATLTPPPAAPTGLTASGVSTSQINLTWTDNASNEIGYRIERAPDAGGVAGTYVEIGTVGADVTTYSSTGLGSGTAYWYRVRAYNAGGTSAYSNEASSATLPSKPAAPTGLTASALSMTSIALTWTDNATNETGYLVERAPDAGGVAGTFVQITSIAANSTSYTDNTLAAGTTYWYRVRAAGQVNSDYSNIVSATTQSQPQPPIAPSNLAPVAVSSSEIDLTWTDNSADETSFTLQRAPDASGVPGTYATIATLGANVTSYKNTGLTVSTTYWYRVRADNAAGSSAWVESKATTLSGPPAAPTTLTAKPTTSALTATLAWKDNATNETGYRIEQAPDNNGAAGTYTEIAVVPANTITYTASGLVGFTKYWFRVRAYNGSGTSSYSNAASVLTALPTDLTVDPLVVNGQPTADVEWFAGSGAKVDIYRNGVKIQSAITNNGSWYDVGRPAGTYVYQICNVGFTGPSQCSNTWSITF